MRISNIYLIPALALMASCSSDDVVSEPVRHEFTITSEVIPFDGEVKATRSTLEGDGFENGDWIRLKIICPFVKDAEYGESTWGNSFDAFFLLKRKNGAWTYLTADDHCDINGTYKYSSSPQVGGWTEAQQTPYVYMASTWSEEKNFRTSEGAHVLQYCHVFHADQRKQEHYKASDLLWAQQYMQTGSWNVHLSFEHKMACITFLIDDTQLKDANGNAAPLTNDAILTLEGMPDIDQQEIIVGDYYAERSKINSAGNFNYKNKSSCKYEHNGKVIGIGVNVDQDKRSYAYPMTGNPNPAYNIEFTGSTIVPNTGIYTAYKENNRKYRLIVPPCKLQDGKNAQIWVRDGERRYMMQLQRTEFHEGELYPVTVKL